MKKRSITWPLSLSTSDKAFVKKLIRPVYDARDWARIVMYDECESFVRSLGPASLDALEISSGTRWQSLGFSSFKETHFPGFDVCEERLDEQFDVIIADQVFEHLASPAKAVANVHAMLKPGGHFIVTVPFLIRVHPSPKLDCHRWTQDGLRFLLSDHGFASDRIQTSAWGNRGYIRAHLSGKWPRRGFFGSLRNESLFPVVVWAFAQKQ